MKALRSRMLAVLAVIAILAVVLAAPGTAGAAGAQYGCYYAAHYVADVTVPDGTVFPAGTAFTKTWRIQNDGNCSWGPDYALHSLVFAGGTNLASAFAYPISVDVAPGQQVNVSIPMASAIYPGRYMSSWKLKVDGGPVVGFGGSGQASIYVLIRVPDNDASSPSGICQYYTVQPGDWLGLIAIKFGTTWQAIAQANHLYNPNFIFPGMNLGIPCP